MIFRKEKKHQEFIILNGSDFSTNHTLKSTFSDTTSSSKKFKYISFFCISSFYFCFLFYILWNYVLTKISQIFGAKPILITDIYRLLSSYQMIGTTQCDWKTYFHLKQKNKIKVLFFKFFFILIQNWNITDFVVGHGSCLWHVVSICLSNIWIMK